MSRYLQSSKSNPFEDDEDDNDFVMVGKPQSSSRSTSHNVSSSSSHSYSSNIPTERNQRYNGSPSKRSTNPYASEHSSSYSYESSPFDDRRERTMRMIDNSENNQLESTQRALASIYDSEAMGVATAEELVRQGETLDNIENKTEQMQQNLKTSQRHLNNIKSVFGGIKNWWNGDKSAESKKPSEPDANARLRATIEKSEATKPDYSGFYEEDDLDSKFMAGARKPGSVGGGYNMISPITRSAREEEVDSNLEMMSAGMSRLKGLAQGLGDEIQRQNDQLDRINLKVEQTDDLLGHQNSQMRRILKK